MRIVQASLIKPPPATFMKRSNTLMSMTRTRIGKGIHPRTDRKDPFFIPERKPSDALDHTITKIKNELSKLLDEDGQTELRTKTTTQVHKFTPKDNVMNHPTSQILSSYDKAIDRKKGSMDTGLNERTKDRRYQDLLSKFNQAMKSHDAE